MGEHESKNENVNDKGGFVTAYELAEQQKKLAEKKPKTEFFVKPVDEIATMFGIPPNIANMFFIEISGAIYVKAPGLLWMAGKKGDFHNEVKETYDSKTGEWTCEVKVFPRVTLVTMKELEKFSPDVQKTLIYSLTQPVTGIGRASKENVENTRMHKFLREMAQTRALNRALRVYTQYGGTSYEELPQAKIEQSD